VFSRSEREKEEQKKTQNSKKKPHKENQKRY
jgi:hypothetical protein